MAKLGAAKVGESCREKVGENRNFEAQGKV